MHRSDNQSLLWLVVLTILIVGSSFCVVLGISTTLPFYLNILAVSGIVGGFVLLSLFKRIQDSEYAYPMWCVMMVVIAASIGCQLILKYQHTLLDYIIGKNGYLYFVERPIQVYFTVCWYLLTVVLILCLIWLLLRLTKRFVVFGFYDLTVFPIGFAFFTLTLGLDSLNFAPILSKFCFSISLRLEQAQVLKWLLLNDVDAMQWLFFVVFSLSILFKLVVAMLYKRRWMSDVKKLAAVALVIWLLILLSNNFIEMVCGVLANYVTVFGALVAYYLYIIMVSWVSLKLFYPHKPINDDE